jgi:hypothetical protein
MSDAAALLQAHRIDQFGQMQRIEYRIPSRWSKIVDERQYSARLSFAIFISFVNSVISGDVAPR